MSHLRPDIGKGGTADNLGGGVLPFSELDRNPEREGIVVQLRVLTDDDAEGVRVMGAIQNALDGIKVQGKPVIIILTRDSVEMSYADVERVANQITPFVLRRLGIRDGVGGELMTGVRVSL